MKKLVSLVTSIVLATAVFAGCGSQNASNSSTTTAASSSSTSQSATSTTANSTSGANDKKVTLSLLIDNQQDLTGMKAVAAAIEKKYNIATEFEIRPGGSDGDNIVKTRLATGDMSDLCAYNSGSLFSALNPEQNFIDLTNEAFMSNILDSFKPSVTVNGKIYGIPSGSTMAGAWLYNKKVYSDLGLSVPKTWAELIANCEKIKAAGKTAVIGSYKDSWTAQLIFLADYYNVQAENPTFANDFNSNKAKFENTPSALRGFEKLQEIGKKGYMNKDYISTTYDTALKMLANGDGAMYPMLTFALPAIQATYKDKANDIGLFAQPGDTADKNGLTVWMPGGIYLNKNGSNVEAELKWASYYASVDGVNDSAAAIKPTGPFAIKNTTLPDDVLPAVKDMLPYFKNGNNAAALEFVSPLKGPNLPQICVEAGAGIKSAKDCAKSYDEDVKKQAKQLNMAGW